MAGCGEAESQSHLTAPGGKAAAGSTHDNSALSQSPADMRLARPSKAEDRVC